MIKTTDCKNRVVQVLLASNLYRPNVGGIENSIRSISDALSSQGVSVDIVCSDYDQQSPSRLPRSERLDNANVFRFRRFGGPFSFAFDIIQMCRVVRNLKARGRDYRLVIARSQRAVLALRLAGQRNVIYLVPAVSAHQDAHRLKDGITSRIAYQINSSLQYLALKVSDKNFVLSENMLDQVLRFAGPRVKAKLIKPGVDQNRFHAVSQFEKIQIRRQLQLPTDLRIALCVGRFSPVKGFDQAISALSRLPEDFVLLIVGEGPCLREYKIQAQQLGVSERLIIRPRTEVPEIYYQSADTFLFTSTQEAFGQTLLEATCSGLPIVAFRTSIYVQTATDEIYKDYPSLVHWAEVNSSDSLASALLDASVQKIGDLSDRENFMASYSWNNAIRKMGADFV